jgi:hypothetical protein
VKIRLDGYEIARRELTPATDRLLAGWLELQCTPAAEGYSITDDTSFFGQEGFGIMISHEFYQCPADFFNVLAPKKGAKAGQFLVLTLLAVCSALKVGGKYRCR